MLNVGSISEEGESGVGGWPAQRFGSAKHIHLVPLLSLRSLSDEGWHVARLCDIQLNVAVEGREIWCGDWKVRRLLSGGTLIVGGVGDSRIGCKVGVEGSCDEVCTLFRWRVALLDRCVEIEHRLTLGLAEGGGLYTTRADLWPNVGVAGEQKASSLWASPIAYLEPELDLYGNGRDCGIEKLGNGHVVVEKVTLLPVISLGSVSS